MDAFLVISAFVLTLLAVCLSAYAYLVKKRGSSVVTLILLGGLFISSTQMLQYFANLAAEVSIPLNFVGMAFCLAGIIFYFRGRKIA